jgi:hypothetical protein
VLSEQKDGKNHALTTTVAVKVLVLISVGLSKLEMKSF